MNNMSFENTMDDYDYTAFDEIADTISDTILTEESKKSKINMCLTKKTSFLDNLVLLELTDPNLIEAIRESKDFELEFKDKYSQQSAKQLYINVSEQLKQYKKNYDKKIGAFEVLYKKTDNNSKCFAIDDTIVSSMDLQINKILLKSINLILKVILLIKIFYLNFNKKIKF